MATPRLVYLPWPNAMFPIFSGKRSIVTIVKWTTMNKTKAIIPRKWRLRATWRPLNILGYQGNLASIAGDIAAPVAIIKGPSRKTTPKYESCCIGLYGSPGGGKWKLAYIIAVWKAREKYSKKLELDAATHHSCRPSPRFLCPGKDIQEENDPSSSNEIQSLPFGIFFFVNLISSLPGFAWSLKYSFGRALSISMPLRIKSVMNIYIDKMCKA